MENLLNEAVIAAAALAPLIAILVQLVKTMEVSPRWLPFISIALGTGTGVVMAMAIGDQMFVYGLAGFLAGASASGLYDAGKSGMAAWKENK